MLLQKREGKNTEEKRENKQTGCFAENLKTKVRKSNM